MASRVVEELITRFTADVKSAVSGFKSMVSGLKHVRDGITSTIRHFNLMFSVVSRVGFVFTALTGTVVGFAAKAYSEFAKIEGAKKSLEALTGSAEIANTAFTQLLQLSQRSRSLTFADALKSFQQLFVSAPDVKWVKFVIDQFSNANALGGRGIEEFNRVIYNMSQILGMGKLTGPELRQTVSLMPLFGKALRDIFGTSDSQTLIKRGVTALEIVDKVSRYFTGLNRAPITAANAWQKFGEAVNLVFAKIGEKIAKVAVPAFEDMTVAMQNLFNMDLKGFDFNYEDIKTQFRGFVADMGASFLQFPALIKDALSEVKDWMDNTWFPGIKHGLLQLQIGIAKWVIELNNALHAYDAIENQKIKQYMNDGLNEDEAKLKTLYPELYDWAKWDEAHYGKDGKVHTPKVFDPEKFKSDRQKILDAFGTISDAVTQEAPPNAPNYGTPQTSLREIAQYTRETAENTRDMSRNAFGGGNLTAMGATPMELRGSRYSGAERFLEEAVKHIGEYILIKQLETSGGR